MWWFFTLIMISSYTANLVKNIQVGLHTVDISYHKKASFKEQNNYYILIFFLWKVTVSG
jgi:hypothetical protein